LYGKQVFLFALVAVRPQMLIALCLDQLRRDAHLLSRQHD
jgi:hypothetical protein